MQATLRRCFLRDFVGQRLLESFEAKDMLASAGQFDGQGDYRTPGPTCERRLSNTSNAACLPTALHAPAALTARTTTS